MLLRFASLLVCLLISAPALFAADGAVAAPLSVDEVIAKLQEGNERRFRSIAAWEGTRVYTLDYTGFFGRKKATATVRARYVAPDKKEFEIVEQSGSKALVERVIEKLLESEKDAAGEKQRRKTALSPDNYSFELVEYVEDGRGGTYVLEVTPLREDKFLYRGKIWVCGGDFAVTRIEAQPAKNPSFWTRRSQIEHTYTRADGFWLPAMNRTVSDIRMGGKAFLTIEYKDFKVAREHASK